jgi:hypothetical protein
MRDSASVILTFFSQQANLRGMKLKPAEYVAYAFGGFRKASLTIGRHHSAISRWLRPISEGGCDGQIPVAMLHPILKAARSQGLDVTLEDLLTGRSVPRKEFVELKKGRAIRQ